MTFIYRWNGEYFGFIKNDHLFDAKSQYLGWVTNDDKVWRKNGTFLGELEDENYILKRTSMAKPVTRSVRAIPTTPATPARRANRAGRTPRTGQVDALDEFADV
ncbi:hypothetical protein SJR98_19840 [Aeromonas hydrophila]|jgi:hypothetical protein|uniref:4-fold beta flower protein n=1 Tax=Aeromonas hydrophila TaxID=644 RepID=UPI0029DC63C1|nr:hypothetical protein [Aeromonas hydrophila]MDX7780335.1 hypothetical protein [Aeromonas hydrophila]